MKKANIPLAVQHLIQEYRRYLRTSYRFLDPHLRDQFEKHLAQADVVVRGPFVTLSRDFVAGSTLPDLVARGEAAPELLKIDWAFGEHPLFRHQERGLAIGRAGRSFVVTTGTGSGKTEAFLLPVMDGIVRRKREGVKGVQAVLLYPMNALANDQLERLRRMLRGGGVDLSIGLYTGDSDATSKNLREEPVENERLGRDAIRSHPPDILLTNYKQLEFLLVRKADRGLFTPSLKFLVLDELHSYRGALATEIACLIRRLKAHAGLRKGELVAIGTSATVASGVDGPKVLAEFASTLVCEDFRPEDVIREEHVPPSPAPTWTPAAPDVSEDDLQGLDPADEASIVALAERLTGKKCPAKGPIAQRIAAILAGNAFVHALEEILAAPCSIGQATLELRKRFADRATLPEDATQLEIQAYLLVGSVGDDEHRPRLRPKLHTFFHGIYDVALCLNPDCRALVPQGGSQCAKCGSAARPAALCRTCGQDFVKLRFRGENDGEPVGTGDFASDDNTGFLTHKLHDLANRGAGDEEDDLEAGHQSRKKNGHRDRAEERLDTVGVCKACGRILAEGENCPVCGQGSVEMLLHRGKMNTCPACGDTYTRGDIVTPLRTGTASTVSVLTTHHLDFLEGEDRKLLVFTDNRQDAAHQAGYSSDKHHSFALRHLIAQEVRDAGDAGIHLEELPQRLLDRYGDLGIARRNLTRPEREKWLRALTYLAANEFTRYSRQRQSLETLGIVGVEYEFLEKLAEEPAFRNIAAEAGLDIDAAVRLTWSMLDVVRHNRAVAYTFFQEYLDPGRRSKYRELEEDPYNVRFPDRDKAPKAFGLDRPDHIRKAGRLIGFFQESASGGQPTATQKLAMKLIGDRARSEVFLRQVVPILLRLEILVQVPRFVIPSKERVAGMKILQIAPRVIRLRRFEEGYRCPACQTWRPYDLGVCATPKCDERNNQLRTVDKDNYYVGLYLAQPPRRMRIEEHSAQIGAEDRVQRETDFKVGKLEALVCTPTLELGVDIGPLLTVVLRNAPPTPANYAQRVGRAGRRLRIGFVSTFCAAGAHDRHAFEHPEWLVAGRFDPPRIRLDNPRIVHRHMRSYVLEHLAAQLPGRMGDFLDDDVTPTRWRPELLESVFGEVSTRRLEMVGNLESLMAEDRRVGRVARFDRAEVEAVVDGFRSSLTDVLEGWWQRVHQLDREHAEFSSIGSPRHDLKKAAARRRAFHEITTDPQRAYTLNYLSTRDILPAYQFPLDTFSLDPGVEDTPTLYRPASIALEEFAPGNFVYANGHKLRSIRVLFAGGPGSSPGGGATDAETSGRLRSFHFCERCDEVVEAPKNECSRCKNSLPRAVDAVFVNSFEAEENLRIGSDEESRHREYFVRRESLLLDPGAECAVYAYPICPIEYHKHSRMLVTNWGRRDPASDEGRRFWICPECGRHQPNDPGDTDRRKQLTLKNWRDHHAKFCGGEPHLLALAYEYQADSLVLTVPSRRDVEERGPVRGSPTLVTLGEALVAATGILLELEPHELSFFTRPAPEGDLGDQIVIYENVPGGAGYVEELARRLNEVASGARKLLFEHRCSKACYLCLKHYRNQRWHPLLDKDVVADVLLDLSELDPVAGAPARMGGGAIALQAWLVGGGAGASPTGRTYTKGAIEEPLREALARIADLPVPQRDLELPGNGQVITVPDFAWPDVRLAVYCDGYSTHGNRESLEGDAGKRNWLQANGWAVLVYWGRTILGRADTCAEETARVYRARAAGHPR